MTSAQDLALRLIVCVLFVAPSIAIGGCKKDDPPAIKETPPPVAASAKAVATGSRRYLIDAAGKKRTRAASRPQAKQEHGKND